MFPKGSSGRTAFARIISAIFCVSVVALSATSANAVSHGTKLWAAHYNDRGDWPDRATGIGTTPDGSTVFVTGSSTERTGGAIVTLAYDAATGTRLWLNRYPGPPDHGAGPVALGVAPDGSRVFVTGAVARTTGDERRDFITVAYDSSTGSRLWVAQYDGPAGAIDYATALAVSPNGSQVFVSGYSETTSRPQSATIAYDATTGAMLWVKRSNGPFTVALGVSPDASTLFVTGWGGRPTEGKNYTTVAYDAATGTSLWRVSYNGPANLDDQPSAIGLSPDGERLFVTGFSGTSTQGADYATVAYDASTGVRLWARRYNGPANANDVATALQVSPDGSRVFVTGFSAGSAPDDRDYATISYTVATGATAWVKRDDGQPGFDDMALAMAVSPDGSSLFVTGSTCRNCPSRGTAWGTVAYAASTGTARWVRLSDHWEDEAPSALVVSPAGSAVFVTGESQGVDSDGRDENYTTVAYGT